MIKKPRFGLTALAGVLMLTLFMEASLSPASAAPTPKAPIVKVVGDWSVEVTPGVVSFGAVTVTVAHALRLPVPPATLLQMRDEKYDELPLFNNKAAPWSKGVRLRPLVTFETTAADSLVPDTFQLKSGPGTATTLKPQIDYALEPKWATIGRQPNGVAAGRAVWADYDYGLSRIDSVVINQQGTIKVLSGAPHAATPLPPKLAPDEQLLANIWLPARLSRLHQDNIYPIVEAAYVVPQADAVNRVAPAASRLLPKSWQKLQNRQPLHVLAWGDSVTAGGQSSDAEHNYQKRFVSLLKQRFPLADIQLTTVAWGGRNSDAFLKEPPGSPYNFQEQVLAARPDLIVMEFVNDAWMSPEVVEQRYALLHQHFAKIGAEWIILTPHFVRPDWMGADTVRVESDPRPYVKGVRDFAAKHHVALADASLRWGHLVKEGIPYVTLLSNSINHPDDRGHELFAAALMELFQ